MVPAFAYGKIFIKRLVMGHVFENLIIGLFQFEMLVPESTCTRCISWSSSEQ